ncbi:MAG: tripartite tricarboxylate transporter substrate binding protein [Candidatus Bathyarchaeia archaeon]
MIDRKVIAAVIAIVIMVAVGAGFYISQQRPVQPAYPTSNIKHIMPWSAGGGTDIVMRAFMNHAEKYLPVKIYTENIVGASSGTGVYALMGSKPDGYTIGTLTWDSVITVPFFGLVPGYDLNKLKFICTVTDHATLIAVHRDSPWKTLKELIEDAKRRPGEISVSNVGLGGVWHLPVLDLERKAGIKFRHVPFPGGAAPQREALIKREVEVACISYGGIFPAIKSGDARVLAVMSESRIPELPDVPTFKELGYDIVWGSFRVIAVPKDTPDYAVKALEEAFKKAANDPEFKKWLSEAGGGGWSWKGSAETEKYVREMQKSAFLLLEELVKEGVIKKS